MSSLVAPPVWYHRSEGSTSRRLADVVETATLWTADDYDAVLVGEPLGGRSADAQTPITAVVREILAWVEVGDDERFASTVADLGDLDVDSTETDHSTVQETVRAFTRRIHERETVPIFLSGDGTLTYPNAAPLLERGSLGVVRLGAVRSYAAADRRPAARRSYRRLFESELDALAVVGTRPEEDVAGGWDLLEDHDWHAVSRETVQARPAEAADGALASMDDVDGIFLSIDLPALNVSEDQLRTVVRRVASDGRVAGLEVIVREPTPDAGERRVHASADAVAHFLLGYE